MKLIVSDIDGVVRDIYTQLWVIYKQRIQDISYHDFLNDVVYNPTSENKKNMVSIIDEIGIPTYCNAPCEPHILGAYAEALKNKNVDLLFCSTKTTDEIEKITRDWLDNAFMISAGYVPKYDVIFVENGWAKKELPQSIIEKYDKFLIIEDNPRVAASLAAQISSYNKNVEFIIFQVHLSNVEDTLTWIMNFVKGGENVQSN